MCRFRTIHIFRKIESQKSAAVKLTALELLVLRGMWCCGCQGTALWSGSLWVRFRVELEFYIDIILTAALWPMGST